MQRLFLLIAVLAAFAFVSSPSSARASCPLCGPQLGAWPNYYAWGSESPYTLGQVPVPPYFALHPPVYYSMPVPRTYGYSPYAYPGTVMTPEIIEAGTPAVVENPYVQPSSLPVQHAPEAMPSEPIDADQHSAAVRPVVIDNPFVGMTVAAHQEAASGPAK